MKYTMVLDKDNNLISKIYDKDNRYLLYLVKDKHKNQYWMLKSEIIEQLSFKNIENVKLVNRKLVVNVGLKLKKFTIKDIHFLTFYIKKRIVKLKENTYDYKRLLQTGVLERLLTDNYIVGGVYKDKNLINLFIVSAENGLNMIHMFEMKEDLQSYQCLKTIITNFKHPILCDLFISSVGLKELGFKEVNKIASLPKQFGKTSDYIYQLNKTYLTNENPDIVVKAIESDYNSISQNNIKVACFTAKQLLDFMYPIRIEIFNDMERIDTPKEWCLSSRSPTIVGFDIFNLSDVIRKADRDNNAIKYLIAYSDKKILGVIKFGYWESCQIFSYIDICLPYRKQGIATLLLKSLSKYLDKRYPIMLTSETKLGKKCRLTERAKKYIDSVPVYSEEEASENPSILQIMK